jgi:hypothetical protein
MSAEESAEDLIGNAPQTTQNLFHSDLAYDFCASIRSNFRGKTQFSPFLTDGATR